MNLRQRLLTDEVYICPFCNKRVADEVDAVVIPAYAHKTCKGLVSLIPEKVVDITKKKLSLEEEEEFEKWKKEKKNGADKTE